MKRSLGLILLATLNHAVPTYADTVTPTENTVPATTEQAATPTTTPATQPSTTSVSTDMPVPDTINCTYAISLVESWKKSHLSGIIISNK